MYHPDHLRARALATSVAAATLLAGALVTGAHAEDAGINEAIFDAQSTYFAAIVKVADDGYKRTTVLPGSVGFDARMKLDTKWPGYVERIGVWLGQCNGPAECGGFQQVLFEAPMQRDYDVNRSISFSTEDLVNARAGATTYGQLILNGCNTKPVTERHVFQLTIDATFSANTRKAVFESGMDPTEATQAFNGGDVTRHDTFEISVECLATSKTTQNPNPKPDPHRTKVEVTDLDLFLTTYVTPAAAGRPSGTTCKPLKVTTRIETDKAGPKNVKLWRQVNGGPITSEVKAMDATALGGGTFGDDWVKWENFTKTTTVQYKAEALGGTFAPSTPWKSITIHCNGNFAPTTSDANPDNGKPQGKPKAESPRVPTIVTPTPVCIGGRLANGACTCPGSHRMVKTSARAFQCVKIAIVPDKGKDAAAKRRQDAAGAFAAEPRRQRFLIKPQLMFNRPSGSGARPAFRRNTRALQSEPTVR
jgi:hypothetical protein